MTPTDQQARRERIAERLRLAYERGLDHAGREVLIEAAERIEALEQIEFLTDKYDRCVLNLTSAHERIEALEKALQNGVSWLDTRVSIQHDRVIVEEMRAALEKQ